MRRGRFVIGAYLQSEKALSTIPKRDQEILGGEEVPLLGVYFTVTEDESFKLNQADGGWKARLLRYLFGGEYIPGDSGSSEERVQGPGYQPILASL